MVDKFKWLRPRVESLIEIAKPFKMIHPHVFYESGGEWSIIKLLANLRFIEIYTKIIKAPRQQAFFDKMYYIDLLSGSGLCKIGKKGDIIAGSALLACTHCYNPFDKYFFVEQDPTRAEALRERIKTVTQDFSLYNCNCNSCINEIMTEIGERDHYLAYIDCEGLDVSWLTMQALLAKNGDILFNFQTLEVLRNVRKAQKKALGWEATTERLNWFFGDSRWTEYTDPDSVLYCYMEKIRNESTRKIVLALPVKGPRGYRYDIILATRLTRGGSPWVKSMQELQEIMGGYKPIIVKKTLDILQNRQATLNGHLLSQDNNGCDSDITSGEENGNNSD
jgi:three-Cys-motif partner protein